MVVVVEVVEKERLVHRRVTTLHVPVMSLFHAGQQEVAAAGGASSVRISKK